MPTARPAGARAWAPKLFAALTLIACTVGAPADAQTAADNAPGAPPAGLSADVAQNLDADLARLESLIAGIQELESEIEGATGLRAQVLDARLDRYWNDVVSIAHGLARQVLALSADGQDMADYRPVVETVLAGAPAALFAEIDRTETSVRLPSDELSAPEQAAINAKAEIAIKRILDLYRALQANIKLANEFGLPTEAVVIEFNGRLEERAASLSAFLDIAQRDARAARAQLAALPGDTEIAARVAVADARVELSASSLKSVTTLMAQQELNTASYDAQIIATTGAVTTDILDVSVVGDLAGRWLDALLSWFEENGGSLFFQVLIFVLILWASFKVANIAQRLLKRAIATARIQMSQLLQRMVLTSTRGGIIAIGILVALSQIGISLGPLLAGLGIAGFVIGFALQDSLSNFASGLMILLYRPYDVGDLVEVGSGVFGTVSAMSLVNTTVLTVDNQTLIVPNNIVWQSVIKNVTAQNRRRVDMVFGIGYGDDIPKAEKILTDIVENHALVLKDPEPVVRLHELGESSVNFVVRPWVKTDDYWPVYWDITREVKMRFDAEGVSIPFPQRDVHLYAEQPVLATAADPGAPARQPHRKEFDTAASSVDDD